MANSVVRIDLKELERIAARLETNVEKVGLAMAHSIEAQAKQLVPYDTHALQNSINVYDVRRAPFYCKIGPHMDYAAAVEYGHLTRPFVKSQGVQRFVAARPYLTPAAEMVRRKFTSAETWKDVLK
jgi:hypothetical protein